MKKYILFCLAILCLVFIRGTIPDKPALSAYDISKSMFAKTKRIITLSYTLKKSERINGTMIVQKSFVKLSRDPFKVYLRQTYPNDGMEVLFANGTNNNLALIDPNGFPWINLNLDPYGSMMRNNQHHTIYDSGYDHVISILEHLFDKYGTETKSLVRTLGTTTWDGDTCWIVEITNPYFKFYNYTLKPGETLLSYAEKNKLSEHMILERNPNLDGYDDAVPGTVIAVPNDYSPRLTLYINKVNMLPVVMKVYDDKGLYENYEYTGLTVDPAINPLEFTCGYKEYSF